MSITRNDTGEVRLAWRLMLVILLYVAAVVLLRIIPISFFTASFVSNGMTHANALEKANVIINEDPVYSTTIGILSGFMGLLIVWFLVKIIEKSNFTWKTVGLDLRSNSLLVILLGIILALLLFIASVLAGDVLGSTDLSLNASMMSVSISIFFQKFILYLAMGFGEEIVFRGYVQKKLVERYRSTWGILMTAVVFVLLHQISYSLSPVIFLSGVMLWTTIGTLYHLSKSLYLVVVFHGVMNTMLNTLAFEVSDIGSMVVHAFALLLVIVAAFAWPGASGISSNGNLFNGDKSGEEVKS
jgi:membrane protease YdiL (CAAX protease family)